MVQGDGSPSGKTGRQRTLLGISRMDFGKPWVEGKTREDGMAKLEKEMARKSIQGR